MSLVIAAAAIKLTPLDFESNHAAIIDAINQALLKQSKIICLPELCISGYGCEDAFFYESVIAQGYKSLGQICQFVDSTFAVIVGLPVKVNTQLFNCVAIINDHKVVGIVPKQHLANDGVHYEKRWFVEWNSSCPNQVILPGINNNKPILLGVEPIELFGKKIAFEVCEDAWVKNRPAHKLANKNVDIIFNPSASHFAFGKYKTRQDLTKDGSRITSAIHVFVNQLGNESGRTIYDGDIVVAKDGQIIAQAKRLTFKDKNILTIDVDSKINLENLDNPNYTEQDYYDFTKACALGLFDYLKKSGSFRFVLSLSGGADSAAVAVLVKAMVYFLIKDNGFNDALKMLNLDSSLKTEQDITNQILHCVYQTTKQNSDITRQAAAEVAKQLGFKFSVIELDDIIDLYQKKIQKIADKDISWQSQDIALQNIQARTRSPGIWMLANINNALLLTTGNRSEAAVGYSTMDGDTSGSLAPIAGVSKIFIQNWLKWLQNNTIDDFGNFSWLKIITAQSPTAELRPLSSKQTDEADLMPYVVLGALEQIVLNKRMPKELVYQEIITQFDGTYVESTLKGWVDKFYLYWTRSQWKRERLAPSFHLDTFSVDSRTWCRFPILSKELI
jgi:NAD+ synthase (glutamine-hydrolysing)